MSKRPLFTLGRGVPKLFKRDGMVNDALSHLRYCANVALASASPYTPDRVVKAEDKVYSVLLLIGVHHVLHVEEWALFETVQY